MDRYELIPWIDKTLPLRGARILEVGCGTGSATVALAEQGAEVTALDVYDEALMVAEARCKGHDLRGVTLVRANAERLGAFEHRSVYVYRGDAQPTLAVRRSHFTTAIF